MSTEYDIIIVGGGVVGLAILRAATLQGWHCALIEQEEDLLFWASGSNSGILCTGVDAAPGTLERALIRDSISNIRLFCKEMNVPYRDYGSLVCQWPWDAEDRLEEVLHESLNAGDTHAKRLTAEQVRKWEPYLNDRCTGAIHIPGEIVVDSWLYSIALAAHARQNGATILTNFEMDPVESSFFDGIWTVKRKVKEDQPNENPLELRARAVINATGLWADLVQTQAQIPCHWTTKPRRGQYRVYQMSSGSLTHPIQPIPTQRTKGIFVFSTLYDQLVVGPTALDQASREDRSVDPMVGAELEEHLLRIMPLADTAYVGDYVGIRPGTNHRDYQISVDTDRKWIACAGIRVKVKSLSLNESEVTIFSEKVTPLAGIRSTGLTASLGIGRHVTSLLHQTNVLHLPDTLPAVIHTNPLPDVQHLVENYRSRKDGTVDFDGHRYRVTHPLTRFGWDAQTGIASS